MKWIFLPANGTQKWELNASGIERASGSQYYISYTRGHWFSKGQSFSAWRFYPKAVSGTWDILKSQHLEGNIGFYLSILQLERNHCYIKMIFTPHLHTSLWCMYKAAEFSSLSRVLPWREVRFTSPRCMLQYNAGVTHICRTFNILQSICWMSHWSFARFVGAAEVYLKSFKSCYTRFILPTHLQ